MKKTIFNLALLLMILFHCVNNSLSRLNTYFIYIDSDDKLLNKVHHEDRVSIIYKCSCYAGNRNLRFQYEDTSKNYTSRKIPAQTYSMLEFAKIADKIRYTSVNSEIWQSEIYVFEQVGRHKYHYYKVKFYPVVAEE